MDTVSLMLTLGMFLFVLFAILRSILRRQSRDVHQSLPGSPYPLPERATDTSSSMDQVSQHHHHHTPPSQHHTPPIHHAPPPTHHMPPPPTHH